MNVSTWLDWLHHFHWKKFFSALFARSRRVSTHQLTARQQISYGQIKRKDFKNFTQQQFLKLLFTPNVRVELKSEMRARVARWSTTISFRLVNMRRLVCDCVLDGFMSLTILHPPLTKHLFNTWRDAHQHTMQMNPRQNDCDRSEMIRNINLVATFMDVLSNRQS